MLNKSLIFLVIISFVLNVFAKEKNMNIKKEIAVFSMGCFWCGESEFRDHATNELLPGILSISVGYAGGTMPDPTYQNHSGYKESVKIVFDSTQISYEKLLDIFWQNVDFLNPDGQFCDIGDAYKSAIFYITEEQKKQAIKAKEDIQTLFKENQVIVEMLDYTTFYDAEEYHQNYKSKNPVRYKYYRWNCDRDLRLQEIWKDKYE